MDPTLILKAISAGVTAIPEGLALINDVKTLVSMRDQAQIDEALAAANNAADEQHVEAHSDLPTED